MELDNFIYGIICIGIAFALFKFNRFWIKEKKSNGEKLDEIDKGPRMAQEIISILILILISIFFFLKSFNMIE
nr:hypothetical protein [uncultured Flavobacterium sp.]